MGAVENAADVCGAKQGRVAVIALTTSSAEYDIQALFPRLGDQAQMFFYKLTADQTTYFFWSDISGESVDETNTGPADPTGGECDVLVAGSPDQHRPSGRYLYVKAASAGFLRIALAQGLPATMMLRRAP